MTLKLAFNTTDTPVLVDAQGYTIGGRSWGVVDSTDEQAQAEYAAGRLIDADEDALAGSGNADALAAVDALQVRRDRLEAARALDKDELVAALPPEHVESMEVGGDGLPAKDDLVEAVAASDANLEVSTTPKKSTSRRSGQK